MKKLYKYCVIFFVLTQVMQSSAWPGQNILQGIARVACTPFRATYNLFRPLTVEEEVACAQELIPTTEEFIEEITKKYKVEFDNAQTPQSYLKHKIKLNRFVWNIDGTIRKIDNSLEKLNNHTQKVEAIPEYQQVIAELINKKQQLQDIRVLAKQKITQIVETQEYKMEQLEDEAMEAKEERNRLRRKIENEKLNKWLDSLGCFSGGDDETSDVKTTNTNPELERFWEDPFNY